LDICTLNYSKFICLLQVGAICLQYSHDDVILASQTFMNLSYSSHFVYSKLVPSLCNVHDVIGWPNIQNNIHACICRKSM